MNPSEDTTRETVEITDHATERTDGGERAKCRLPDSVIESVVLQRKGKQYADTNTGTVHFLYNATVIVADYQPESNHWFIVTAYRDPDAESKRRSTRYKPVDVDQVVEQAQSN